jgi:ABC-2 type transport system permease protein
VPVVRRMAGYEFRDMQFVDYPYLLDVRDDGLNDEHPITSSLPQLTVGWASPIEIDGAETRTVTPLLSSSDRAWRSTATDVMPSLDAAGLTSPSPDAASRVNRHSLAYCSSRASSAASSTRHRNRSGG